MSRYVAVNLRADVSNVSNVRLDLLRTVKCTVAFFEFNAAAAPAWIISSERVRCKVVSRQVAPASIFTGKCGVLVKLFDVLCFCRWVRFIDATF